MSVSVQGSGSFDARVVAGDKLVLHVRAYDPAGIGKIFVQCFQFSMANSTRAKLATGEIDAPANQSFSQGEFEISIQIPENAALGKWGIQLVEFTNGRGYKSSFYRGQGKFDHIVFEVIPPPSKEDELLRFNGIEIANSRRYA